MCLKNNFFVLGQLFTLRLLIDLGLFVLYNAHWSVHFYLIFVKKNLLQSYDKVSINISVYNLNSCKMCKNFIYSIIPYQSAFSRVPSHRKNHISFVLNHRLIKKCVIKQIKLFSLGKGGACKPLTYGLSL